MSLYPIKHVKCNIYALRIDKQEYTHIMRINTVVYINTYKTINKIKLRSAGSSNNGLLYRI